MTVAPGDVLGDRYEIVRLIGKGGMGAVFEARHKVLGRAVAIKVLKPEIAHNEHFAQRFLVEAKAAAELHHRNIVELTDYGVDAGRPYMVMELLQGESLAQLIQREGPLSMERVVGLFTPVLKALAFAHDRGVIHRDIKPENIFLVREDDGEITPKIVDFGIAKRQEESVQLTSANMALGTPAYMAPEQIVSSHNVTGAADQYAVGVAMYEALTRKNPFEAESLNAFIVAKATQDPIPLLERRPELDPHFAAVVMRTLARKPEERFPSVTALREALAPYAQHASLRPPSVAEAPTVAQRSLPSGPTPAQAAEGHRTASTEAALGMPGKVSVPSVQGTTSPSPGAHTKLWLALAGVLAMGAVGGVMLATRRNDGASQPSRSATVDGAASPTVAQVVFSITVEPREAEIRLDGEVVGHGRAEILRPRDGRAHQLVVTAPGYTTVTEVLTAMRDVQIERQLQRTPEGPSTAVPPSSSQPSGRGRMRTTLPPSAGQQLPVPPSAPSVTPPASPTAPAPPQPQTSRRTHDPSHPQVDPTNPFETP
jgi:serine/threonine-protein kinase